MPKKGPEHKTTMNTIQTSQTTATPAAPRIQSTSTGEYTIEVPAGKWSELLRLKAEASALDKQIKKLQSELAFPEAAQLAIGFGLTEEDSVSIRIVNGNGDTCGKMSVYWYSGATIPAAWRSRIS